MKNHKSKYGYNKQATKAEPRIHNSGTNLHQNLILTTRFHRLLGLKQNSTGISNYTSICLGKIQRQIDI